MKYWLLVFLWTAWCILHSGLISLSVTGRLRRRFGDRFRYYRLLYNAFALVTLAPVAAYAFSIRTPPFFYWEGSLKAVQYLLLLISIALFYSATRNYDTLQFLGIRQLKQANACHVLTENCELDTTGILGAIRHPWYLGGMIIVWARNLDTSAIITNMILTAYFIIGAFLEERKLLEQFGETYRAYQHRVPMFFPHKWLKAKLLARG